MVKCTSVEVVKKLNSKHSHVASGNSWTSIEGCMHLFNLAGPAEIEVIGHGHGNVHGSERRLDFGIFIDGQLTGMNGTEACPGWEAGHIGVALSHTSTWIPMICIANTNLASGVHSIEAKIRSVYSGDVSLHGVGMTIKIFHEVDVREF